MNNHPWVSWVGFPMWPAPRWALWIANLLIHQTRWVLGESSDFAEGLVFFKRVGPGRSEDGHLEGDVGMFHGKNYVVTVLPSCKRR